MIKIKKITPCCGSCDESDVILTNGKVELTCITYSTNLHEGQEIKDPLYAWVTSYTSCQECSLKNQNHIFASYDAHIIRSDRTISEIEKLANMYEYHLSGKLLNRSRDTILIDDFIIEVDESIPNDILIGEFVTFHCTKLTL